MTSTTWQGPLPTAKQGCTPYTLHLLVLVAPGALQAEHVVDLPFVDVEMKDENDFGGNFGVKVGCVGILGVK
eukprot:1256351-Prorocentrum_lima.AAC.1